MPRGYTHLSRKNCDVEGQLDNFLRRDGPQNLSSDTHCSGSPCIPDSKTSLHSLKASAVYSRARHKLRPFPFSLDLKSCSRDVHPHDTPVSHFHAILTLLLVNVDDLRERLSVDRILPIMSSRPINHLHYPVPRFELFFTRSALGMPI